MTREITIKMLLGEVPGLTQGRLERFVAAGIVTPVQRGESGEPGYLPLDRARLALACDLADAFELQDDALAMVLDLVDQVHGLRGELRALMQAVAAEPEDTRLRLAARLRELRSAG